MLTDYEARKLRSQMTHELSATERDVLICAVLLLLLHGLTWLGAVD